MPLPGNLYGGAYGQGGVPRYPHLPVGGGGVGVGFPGGAQGFPGGAQGFSGGVKKDVSRKENALQEELEGVNRIVRKVYEQEREKRKEKARENHEEKSSQPKTSMATRAFLQGDKSELEVYLERLNMHPKVLFECTEVKERVNKKFPAFYGRYRTPQAVWDAMAKHKAVWRWDELHD